MTDDFAEPAPRLSRDALIGQIWEYTLLGRPTVSANFCFGPDGEILGYTHHQESHWSLDDGSLAVLSKRGTVTWRFRAIAFDHGTLLIGRYEADPTATHLVAVLRALRARPVVWERRSLARIAQELGATRALLLLAQPPMPFRSISCPLDRDLAKFAGSSADQRRILTETTLRGSEIWEISGALIQGRQGLVAIGDRIATETLSQFPRNALRQFEAPEATTVPQPARVIASALYALTANLENYFHFLIEAIGRLWCGAEEARRRDVSVVIVPEPKRPYQAEILAFCRARFPALTFVEIGSEELVRIDRLILPMPYPNTCLYPNGAMRGFLEEFGAAWKIGWPGSPAPARRRLYVSRRDSASRPMENQAELEETLARHGFDCVTMTGLTVDQQALLFASACIVVGAHGAGLTNIAFCEPGTPVIEIHSWGDTNWVYRRICNVLSLPYSYIVGQEDVAAADIPRFKRAYRVDTDALLAAIAEAV